MEIPVNIYQRTKKLFVKIQPKNACKLEFADNLSITFLDQPQYVSVVFAIINFHIYNILITKWKHEIGPNDIIKFNEELEFLSTSTIELVNINESSPEEAAIIFITNKDLNTTENNYVPQYDNGN